ncbi:MAG: hypothetical protein ACE1Z6_10815, partial [Candidatus Methylomirabilales bacterium]
MKKAGVEKCRKDPRYREPQETSFNMRRELPEVVIRWNREIGIVSPHKSPCFFRTLPLQSPFFLRVPNKHHERRGCPRRPW